MSPFEGRLHFSTQWGEELILFAMLFVVICLGCGMGVGQGTYVPRSPVCERGALAPCVFGLHA